MAKRTAKRDETTEKTDPKIAGKITATSIIEFKHPYESGTLFRPSITLEFSIDHERPIDDEGNALTNDQIMDDLLAQVTSALNRNKCKTMDRLMVEEKLTKTRYRLAILRRQPDRPLSEESKKSYSAEEKVLVENEERLLLELEAITI